MSYQLYFGADLGASAAGLTMNGKLFDAAGTQVGATIAAGIAEVAPGAFGLMLSLPDGHVGSFVLYAVSDPTMRAFFAINPQEGENLNARVDSRLAASAYSAPPTVAGIWGHGERTLTTAPSTGSGSGATPAEIWSYAERALTTPFPAPPSAAEIRQEMDANSGKLALLDAPVSGQATPAHVAAASSALLSAITGLHNLSAADVDDRLVAYGAATGGELAAAAAALQAMIGALHNLSSSETQAAMAAALAARGVPTAADILAAPVTEPTGAFDWSVATLGDIVSWIGAIHRNKMQQGAAVQVLRNGIDTTDIATAETIDDGATLTRGAWV